MKRIRYIVVACFTCLWCSCYQGMLLEDTFLDEENVMDVNPTPFPFSSLFPQTNGGMVYCRPWAYYINGNQWFWVNHFGQDLMNKDEILSRMAFKLHGQGKTVSYAIDPRMKDDPQMSDKDAIYDPQNRIIFLKNEIDVTSQRILLHELLHAFQTHLAGVEFTDENRNQTEFEVLLMYDVFECRMRKEPSSSEGGNSKGYKDFVSQIANFELSGDEGIAQERLIEMFEKYYKEWAGGATTIYYRPSF